MSARPPVSIGMKQKKKISWQLPQLKWIPYLKPQLLTFLKTLKLEEASGRTLQSLEPQSTILNVSFES